MGMPGKYQAGITFQRISRVAELELRAYVPKKAVEEKAANSF
jgi:hypothetical protein